MILDVNQVNTFALVSADKMREAADDPDPSDT